MIEKLANLAETKWQTLKENPMGYFALSLLAGMFIGFGILLVFTISGQLAGAPSTKLIMGMSFACALSLVIVAGGELFTGNNLVVSLGIFREKVTIKQGLILWIVCWIGNLLGSWILASLFSTTWLATGPTLEAMNNAAITKTTLPFLPLFNRAILCNILVCLAVWCANKTDNDAAKLIMIFWCILAFFTTGFEHSIANMTLFGVALIDGSISWSAALYNLGIVTLGNMVGGIIFVAFPYYLAE